MTSVGELHTVTTFDGVVFDFNDAAMRFVISTPGNMGLPPIQYQTRTTYKADGLVETGFRAETRVFNLDIYLRNDCSRDAYWQIRDDIIEALRPNRGGPSTYAIVRSDGSKRAISIRSLGLGFAPTGSEEWTEWTVQESLQFEAFDPAWFDPTQVSTVVTATPGGELSFPVTFDDDNVFFDESGEFGQLAISYAGSWYSYPIITITAPFSSVQITHLELGVNVAVLRDLSAGSLIIDLVNRTFLTSDGTNYGPYVTAASDLQGFRIEPDPVVSGGTNTLSLFVQNAIVPTTAVTVAYYTRYIGI